MGGFQAKNEIEYFEDHAEIICISRDSTERRLLIDLEDVEKAKQYRWRVNIGYGVSHDTKENGYRRIYLHRFITGVDKDRQIDHMNFNRFDCRKSNLRECSHFQNVGHKSNNTSGVCGVNFRKGKWRAYIYIYVDNKKPKQIYLGDYKDKDDAIKARAEAELKYYGENSFR